MQPIKSPLTLKMIPKGTKSCIFHGYGGWYQTLTSGTHEVFPKINDILIKDGLDVYCVQGDSKLSKSLLERDHLHIIVGGPPLYGPTILHLHPSHIWGFWYLDELGHGWHSSQRFSQFNPQESDPRKSRFFFDGVCSFMLTENVSKQPQEPRMEAPLRPAFATILCSENGLELDPRRDFISLEHVIATTARKADGDLVYVKPHPFDDGATRRKLENYCAKFDNIKVTDASLHDLVEAARVTVCHGSSAGFEALLQRRTVITCAKSDYWQATLTPKTVEELEDALIYGLEAMAGFDFEGFVYWFLARCCVEPAHDDFEKRLLARITDKVLRA